MQIPARYAKPPPGYPDLRFLQILEEGGCGVPRAALESHLIMLDNAGTLRRTHHYILRLAVVLAMDGGQDILGGNIMEAIGTRSEDDPEPNRYWSDSTH